MANFGKEFEDAISEGILIEHHDGGENRYLVFGLTKDEIKQIARETHDSCESDFTDRLQEVLDEKGGCFLNVSEEYVDMTFSCGSLNEDPDGDDDIFGDDFEDSEKDGPDDSGDND